MYKVEIFTDQMTFASATLVSDDQTIDLDYFSYDPFSITTGLIDCKKGYFVHITRVTGELVADGIVSDVQPDKKTQSISIRPLQTLFDCDIFSSYITDCITWIKDSITSNFINSGDSLQNRPITLTYQTDADALPLIDDFDPTSSDTFNILTVISSALKIHNVFTNCWLDMQNLKICIDIRQVTATKVIEADLENVLSSSVTLGDSYGSINKVICRRLVQDEDGNYVVPSSNAYVSFYRYSDDSIGAEDPDKQRIFPVFTEHISVKQNPEWELADWIIEAYAQAYEKLTPEKYDQEIILTYIKDDFVSTPMDIPIGTTTTVYLKGTKYTSILAGVSIKGNKIKLTFGAVRTELTKKLNMSKIDSGKGSVSGSGSSSGGGGGSSDYNSLSNKPKINGIVLKGNKTAADLGLNGYNNLIDKPQINGVTLSGNKTGSDLGLDNYTNLQNKPSINGVTLSGNKTTADLGINYSAFEDKPSINGVSLSGNKTSAELGVQNALTAGNMVDITSDVISAEIPYAEPDVDTSRTVFTVTVPNVSSLEDGVMFMMRNTKTVASNTNWTINVNNLGALKVYNSQSGAQVSTQYAAGSTYLFIYSSALDSGAGGWYMYFGYDTNTNTIGYQLRAYDITLPAQAKFYRYRLLFTSADNTKWIPANTSTSTNATAVRTPTTEKINPFGRIVYYGTTAAIEANALPSASYLWDQYNGITFGYSFNNTGAALTLTANLPIYLKCSPQSDNTVIIDSTTPYVQALPSTEDGYVYIYLGNAITATTITMFIHHPIYWYKYGTIRQWFGNELTAGNGISITNKAITINDLILDCGSSTVNVGV